MDTSVPDFQSLAARVERLEKQYRWLKFEVVTEKIVLVDADGKTRASLCMPDGVPSLILHDAEGNIRAVLRVSPEGPALHLLDAKTKAGLELTVGDSGPNVSLFDVNGKQRLSQEVIESGPGLKLVNENGKSAVALCALRDSPSTVALVDWTDATGNTSLWLTVDSHGPSLLCNKDGKVVWSTP
jgi:hypothetical protein